MTNDAPDLLRNQRDMRFGGTPERVNQLSLRGLTERGLLNFEYRRSVPICFRSDFETRHIGAAA